MIFTLQAENSKLEERARRSAQGDSPTIRVQDGLDTQRELKPAATATSHTSVLQLNSDSSNKHAGSQSNKYADTQSPIRSYSQSQTIQNEHGHPSNFKHQNSSSLGSMVQSHYEQTNSFHRATRSQGSGQKTLGHHIHVGGSSIEEPSGTRRHDVSSRIGEHNLTKEQHEIESLSAQLEVQQRMTQRMDEKERGLLQEMQMKDEQYRELQAITHELKSQAVINSDALDKAGKVIKKLNDDLQRTTAEKAKLENDIQTYKEDNLLKIQQMQKNDKNLQMKEQGLEAKMQRTQEDHDSRMKQLKDDLEDLQAQANQEKKEMRAQISEQQKHILDLNRTISELEAVAEEERTRRITDGKKRSMEVLDIHNRNLGLQIDMKTLEQQVEQDIAIARERHSRELAFLRNQIAEKNVQLNSQMFLNENIVRDQDGEQIPKINQSYLAQVTQEFKKLADEYDRLRQVLNEKSESNLKSYLSSHLEKFSEFQKSVLARISDWDQKTKEHRNLANKYFAALESYKMMFIQMKQLVKQKDLMLREMQAHMGTFKQAHDLYSDKIQKELHSVKDHTLAQLKHMTTDLED